MKKLILIVLVFTATLLSAEDAQPQIDAFFKLYQDNKIPEAIDSIYKSNRFVSNKKDDITSLKQQLEGFLKNDIGSLQYIRRIAEYKVSDIVIHTT